jgi:hypothetical protein
MVGEQQTFNLRERTEGFLEGLICGRGLLFSTLLVGIQLQYHHFLFGMVHHGGITGSWNQ